MVGAGTLGLHSALLRRVSKGFIPARFLSTRDAAVCVSSTHVVPLPAAALSKLTCTTSTAQLGTKAQRAKNSELGQAEKCPSVLHVLHKVSTYLVVFLHYFISGLVRKRSHTLLVRVSHDPTMIYSADSRRRGELRAYCRHLTSKLKS